MADPISFKPQSSDTISGLPNMNEKIIYKGKVSLITATTGSGALYAPYFYAEHTIDLSFLNTAGLFPAVEVWRHTGSAGTNTFIKAPYTFVDPGTLNIAEYVKVQVNENISKVNGYTLGLTLALFHKTQNITREFYFTVLASSIGSTDATQYTDWGTFSA